MESDRYDLTRIKVWPGQLIPEELFPKRCDIHLEISRQKDVKSFYFQQRDQIHGSLDEISQKINAPILKGLEHFIFESIGEERLFDRSPRIHVATLMLDMQTTDHYSTFRLIEDKVDEVNDISFQRISSALRRKRNLIELIDLSENQAENLFIMIEQAETMDNCLAETLVGNLYHRLRSEQSSIKTIMLLLCLSTKLQELPFDSMNCFGKTTDIKRNFDLDRHFVEDLLIRCPDTTMKLAAPVVDLIYDCFTNNDASVANVRYMLECSLHQFCWNLYLSGNYKYLLAKRTASEIDKNHQFICDQLYCYYELLRSPKLWPDDIRQLYDELLSHNDLGSSQYIYESKANLTADILMGRLKRARMFGQKTLTREYKNGIFNIIKRNDDMIENNDDYDATQFINQFLQHATTLKNPLMGDGSIAYFKDFEKLSTRILDRTRSKESFEKSYLASSAYYSLLCRKVCQSAAQINANDFWFEVKDDLEKLICEERAKAIGTPSRLIKSTPRKKSKTTVRAADKKEIRYGNEEITGVAKVMFMDLISTLEHQHLIKLDKRGSKGLLIKRSFWLK